MSYTFSYTPSRIVPGSSSDVALLDVHYNSVTPVSLVFSGGKVTVVVASAGTYVLVFNDGGPTYIGYQELVKFDASTGNFFEMYGYRIYRPSQTVGGPVQLPYVTSGMLDPSNGHLLLMRGDGSSEDVGDVGIAGTSSGTPRITVSTTAPSSPAQGDIWFDIS